MLWTILSLATALTVAIRDVSIKISNKDLSVYEIAGLELFWSLPFLCAAMIFIPIPELDSTFWLVFFLSFPLNWAAYILYISAISMSPLSLTVPLLSFTPIFIIITGNLVLGEEINFAGGLGIILIVLSSYLLNFDKISQGIFRPISELFTNRGSFYMLIVAFIFSFAAVLGKKAMQHSSALFFGFSFFILCNLTLLAGLAFSGKFPHKVLIKQYKYGLSLGLLMFTHILFHCLAIMKVNAAYMVSIKRSSILFSVILGWLILKESKFKTRGPAALLMFLGAILISLFG